MLRATLWPLTWFFAVFWLAGLALSCPFCLAPPQTFAEQFQLSDFAVVAELVRVDASGGSQPGRSLLKVRSILNGKSEDLQACGLQLAGGIVYPGELTGRSGDLFLLYGDRGLPQSPPLLQTFSLSEGSVKGGSVAPLAEPAGTATTVSAEPVDWTENLAISGLCFGYLQGLPVRSRPASERLRYYAGHLESEDAEVAGDAWAEFAGAAYEDVKANRDLYQPAQLRAWIADPLVSPERLGLYGLLLGLSGDRSDADFLRERFVDGGTGEFRFGAEGLLGGYLLLTGESGLSQVEQDFLGSSGRDTMRLALAQSLDFFRIYEPRVISAEQCSRCMRRLAAGRVLRFTAVTSLARWGDWGALPELMRLADAELGPIRQVSVVEAGVRGQQGAARFAGVRPILEFAEQCLRAGSVEQSDSGVVMRPSAEQMQQAERFLRRVRAEHPELLPAAEPEFVAPQ